MLSKTFLYAGLTIFIFAALSFYIGSFIDPTITLAVLLLAFLFVVFETLHSLNLLIFKKDPKPARFYLILKLISVIGLISIVPFIGARSSCGDTTSRDPVVLEKNRSRCSYDKFMWDLPDPLRHGWFLIAVFGFAYSSYQSGSKNDRH